LYPQQRNADTDRIRGFKDGDCFHNGEKALDTVSRWHEEVLPIRRQSDYLTAAVVDLIPDALEKSSYRLSAEQLWGKSQRILSDAGRQHAKEAERLASNGTKSTSPREPAHQPSGPPPPQQTYFAEQTPPRSSRKQSSNDPAMNLPSPILGGPRAHSPDSMTTIGNGSPDHDPNRTHSGRRLNRPMSQPAYSTHRPNQSSYSQYNHPQAHIQEPTISEEDPYDDYYDRQFANNGTGKEPTRAGSTRTAQPQLEPQQNRRSVPIFDNERGGRATRASNVSENYGRPTFAQAGEPSSSNHLHREQATSSFETATPHRPHEVSAAQPPLNRGPSEPAKSLRPEKPYLSVGEALAWKAAKQNKFRPAPPPLPHEYLRDRLAKRDHVSISPLILSSKTDYHLGLPH